MSRRATRPTPGCQDHLGDGGTRSGPECRTDSISGRRPEPLKPQREPVSIRAILGPNGQVDLPAVEPLERLQHGPIMLP